MVVGPSRAARAAMALLVLTPVCERLGLVLARDLDTRRNPCPRGPRAITFPHPAAHRRGAPGRPAPDPVAPRLVGRGDVFCHHAGAGPPVLLYADNLTVSAGRDVQRGADGTAVILASMVPALRSARRVNPLAPGVRATAGDPPETRMRRCPSPRRSLWRVVLPRRRPVGRSVETHTSPGFDMTGLVADAFAPRA